MTGPYVALTTPYPLQYATCNKIQSETAYFTPVPPPCRTGRNIRVVSLCEKMTSSTKPEIHNVLHCRQRMTVPWPQVTCTEHLVKFGRVIFEVRERTDRQTDILIAIFRTTTNLWRTNVVQYRALAFSLRPFTARKGRRRS